MRKLKPAILLAVSVLIFLIGGAHGIAKTNEIEEVIVDRAGERKPAPDTRFRIPWKSQ